MALFFFLTYFWQKNNPLKICAGNSNTQKQQPNQQGCKKIAKFPSNLIKTFPPKVVNFPSVLKKFPINSYVFFTLKAVQMAKFPRNEIPKLPTFSRHANQHTKKRKRKNNYSYMVIFIRHLGMRGKNTADISTNFTFSQLPLDNCSWLQGKLLLLCTRQPQKVCIWHFTSTLVGSDVTSASFAFKWSRACGAMYANTCSGGIRRCANTKLALIVCDVTTKVLVKCRIQPGITGRWYSI